MDLQKAFDEGFDALKGYVDRSFEQFAKQIDALEKRIAEAETEAIADLSAVKSDIESLRKTVDAIPEPQEAIAPELPDIQAMVDEAVEAAVSAIPAPQDGKSVTVEELAPLIAESVQKAVSAIPMPKDGCDGKDGRDGLDVKDLFRADGGRLIAVMSDGTTKDLGIFVGKDGADGAPGIDGIGFDDMTCDVRDDGVYLVWEKGDLVKEARLPIPVDVGVYKADEAYKSGHCVSWGGSLWIAKHDKPQGKPDAPDSGWRLCVKKGRDGR